MTGRTGQRRPGGPAFAVRLDRLFRGALAAKGRAGPGGYPGGTELSYRQVAAGIHTLTGNRIGVATLHALRTGAATDPRMSTVEAIAQYFGVPVGYFFDQSLPESTPPSSPVIRDERVEALAQAAQGLSASSLDRVRAVIDQARETEGLD